MALPIRTGARVDIDMKETIEQSMPATFTYIVANGTTVISGSATRVYTVAWAPDAAGTITLHNAGSASNAFLSSLMADGGSLDFGPNGLLLDQGLTVVVASAIAVNVTLTHTA